jgi:hypothetical protein
MHASEAVLFCEVYQLLTPNMNWYVKEKLQLTLKI